MESGIQSSFIPHDAAEPKYVPKNRYGSGGLADLLLLVAIVGFIASAALAGAAFLYQQYAQTSAASKLTQLKSAEAAFEPSLIQQLTRLDDRMHAAEQVLGTHLAPTTFFQSLEASTLQTISFQSLDLEAPDAQHITVKMSGVAESVNSIALQADLFSKSNVITSPIFSDINRAPDGVHFNLTALVNPTALNYIQMIQGQTPAAATVQVAPGAAQASPFSGQQPSQPAQQPSGSQTQTPAQPTQGQLPGSTTQ